jgi:hypothetical protein
LSLPNAWKIRVDWLVRQFPDGERSVRTGLHELIELGYLVCLRKRSDKGRMGETEYVVYEHVSLRDERQEPLHLFLYDEQEMSQAEAKAPLPPPPTPELPPKPVDAGLVKKPKRTDDEALQALRKVWPVRRQEGVLPIDVVRAYREAFEDNDTGTFLQAAISVFWESGWNDEARNMLERIYLKRYHDTFSRRNHLRAVMAGIFARCPAASISSILGMIDQDLAREQPEEWVRKQVEGGRA